MVDDLETRWPHYDPVVPRRMGKICSLEKFDSTFFGIQKSHALAMDPQSRILVEKAYEAVLDAGVNPNTLRNSNTGVYVGACFSESDKSFLYDNVSDDGQGVVGYVIFTTKSFHFYKIYL